MRQVTHALLTRPPLTFQSLGFMKSPFDLHVLGTPPAFILSQDQTLMFKFVRSKSVWLILPFYCCFRFLFSEISLRTFCSVWNFQGCITVYLSKIKTSCSARAVLLCCCSQRQLWYLIITAFVCQQLFSIFSNLFLDRKTFIFAVEFHTTTLLRALSTTFYIYFSKHLHNGGNGAKKEISIS